LDRPNPTSFVFPAKPDAIKTAITKVFAWIPDGTVVFGPLWAARALSIEFNSADAIFGKAVFAKPNTADDVFLHNFRHALCVSDAYVCGTEPAEFEADFHLHLTRLEPSMTRVDVLILGPMVRCGTLSGLPGHPRALRRIDVDPTSIEEYRILLAIGSELVVKDMPPLRLPDQKAKLTIVKGKGHY
jgi:hypothetical protein